LNKIKLAFDMQYKIVTL